MNAIDWIQLGLFIAILLLTTKPLGLYMGRIFDGERTLLSPILIPVEKMIYRMMRVNPSEDQTWNRYSIHLLTLSGVSLVFTYAVLRLQQYLPLNPLGREAMSPHLALNTAVSFTSNTNWQSYSGESTLSNFAQMVGLTLQNFFSAAVGISAAVALIRGIQRNGSTNAHGGIGNFWTDFVRANLYLLLPLCVAYAVFLVSQGVVQTFASSSEITTLEGVKQIIALGPVASQAAIKMLGTNGGGFFNANAAHPFENPTPLSNFIQMLSIFLIPSGLVYLLGSKVKQTRHGWAVWATMALFFVGGTIACAHFEAKGNPLFTQLGCSARTNWEGKESRFGIFNSALFATVTTDASCGAVNGMHDSFTPMGGFVPLVNILLGEIIFGGVGSGLYGMLMYVILTVFIAGLMVGRTPEYLGKKIEGREVKFVTLAIMVSALSILGLTAWGSLDSRALAGLSNPENHGFSEVFYAFSSATGNNGSAFAGLTANAPFWNLALAFAMFFGRFFMMIPMLATAGSLAKKKFHPIGEGTFPVDGPLFVALLAGVIFLIGALTYFPALSLGPITEHFQMMQGNLSK